MDTIVKDFQKWEKASRDTIDVKRCYMDLAGDLVIGVLLSQIICWFLPQNGEKPRIERQGKRWLAKARTDWWDECRISPKQFDRGIKILRAQGLVETRLFRFRGSPTLHICLNWSALVEGVKCILTKGENRPYPLVKSDINQRANPLTETTNIDYRTDYSSDDEEERIAHVLSTYENCMGKLNDIVRTQVSPVR